jgi:hypothetical protein
MEEIGREAKGGTDEYGAKETDQLIAQIEAENT